MIQSGTEIQEWVYLFLYLWQAGLAAEDAMLSGCPFVRYLICKHHIMKTDFVVQ